MAGESKQQAGYENGHLPLPGPGVVGGCSCCRISHLLPSPSRRPLFHSLPTAKRSSWHYELASVGISGISGTEAPWHHPPTTTRSRYVRKCDKLGGASFSSACLPSQVTCLSAVQIRSISHVRYVKLLQPCSARFCRERPFDFALLCFTSPSCCPKPYDQAMCLC